MPYRGREVSRHLVKRRENQIPDRMAGKVLGIFKSVLVERCEYRVVTRKRDETFPNVSHCGHIESLPQHTGRSAAVGDRDDGGDIQWVALIADFRKSLQKDRKTCAAAYSNDLHRPCPETTTLIVFRRIKRSSCNEMFLV